MASGTEIKGSRKESDGTAQRVAVRLFASDDGTSGLPSHGDDYPGDAAAFPGNSELRRKCIGVSKDPNVIAGLWYHEARYVGMKAHA